MLHEYIVNFIERNKNLHVFSATLHLDETCPHAHIDFIPFYTEGRKNGLSKGVSMKAALIEQGFVPKGIKENQLVMWQSSEMGEMEKVLNLHGLARDVKGATHAHMTVSEYKKSMDEKRLTAVKWKKELPDKLQLENSLLKIENEKLNEQINSPWKSFFYSSQEKQDFVISELDRLNISYRFSENGFEAQAFNVEEIRKIEKTYKPPQDSRRDELRDTLDRVVMQSKDFEDVLKRLEGEGYEVKRAKYIAVKPKYGSGFIRLRSLGEDYSELAIRNRLINKNHFTWNVEESLKSSKNELSKITSKTMKQYTIVFASGVLPIRKKNKKKPFEWTNDVELDRLAELNKKINRGMTLESLRADCLKAEERKNQNEAHLEKVKSDSGLPGKLYKIAFNYFNFDTKSPHDKKVLDEYGVTINNYKQTSECVTAYILKCENIISEDRDRVKTYHGWLTLLEKVIAGTHVQSLVEEEKQRQQSDWIPNGLKTAGADNSKLEKAAEEIVAAQEQVFKPSSRRK